MKVRGGTRAQAQHKILSRRFIVTLAYDIIYPQIYGVMHMEDKSFELLEKMYSEFIGFRGDMNEFRKETNSRLNQVEGHITRLENKLDNNSKALFDGYQQMSEKLEIIEGKVDSLSGKVDRHDIKIQVIEGGRK
jgi:DNA-binding FrmR family transcriptional regulator